MGQNTFTVKLNTGATATASAFIEDVEFVRGYWCSDKEAKNLITLANLGDTVYFCAIVKGIKDGEQIDLKLYEDDGMFWDYFDDDTFNEEEINKTAIVQSDEEKSYIIQELHLDAKWESEIVDDTGDMIELYWELSYKNYSKKLPDYTDIFLRVEFSERTLYLLPANYDYQFPELADFDGTPLIILDYTQNVFNNTKENIFDALNSNLDKRVRNIALAKLENGHLATNEGNVYVKNTQLYTKDVYTNDGTLLKDVKMRRQFGFNHGNGLETTTTVSQVDFFSQKGYKVKFLKALKNVGSSFDIIDLANSATSDLNISDSVALPLGALTPISEIANMLITEEKERFDSFLEKDFLQILLRAKAKDLNHVKAFVDRYGDDTNYFLKEVPTPLISKLLKDEFKSMEEVIDEKQSLDGDYEMAYVLYRTFFNPNINRDIEVIETIYLNQ